MGIIGDPSHWMCNLDSAITNKASTQSTQSTQSSVDCKYNAKLTTEHF